MECLIACFLICLSDVTLFRLETIQKPLAPSLLSPPPTQTRVLLLSFMPRLKETYLQIKERNRREIRNRTAARIAQLLQTTSHEDEGSDEGNDEEENASQTQTSVQYNRLPLLVFLFILLVLLLLVVHIRLR
jgi:hypothetical protein